MLIPYLQGACSAIKPDPTPLPDIDAMRELYEADLASRGFKRIPPAVEPGPSPKREKYGEDLASPLFKRPPTQFTDSLLGKVKRFVFDSRVSSLLQSLQWNSSEFRSAVKQEDMLNVDSAETAFAPPSRPPAEPDLTEEELVRGGLPSKKRKRSPDGDTRGVKGFEIPAVKVHASEARKRQLDDATDATQKAGGKEPTTHTSDQGRSQPTLRMDFAAQRLASCVGGQAQERGAETVCFSEQDQLEINCAPSITAQQAFELAARLNRRIDYRASKAAMVPSDCARMAREMLVVRRKPHIQHDWWKSNNLKERGFRIFAGTLEKMKFLSPL